MENLLASTGAYMHARATFYLLLEEAGLHWSWKFTGLLNDAAVTSETTEAADVSHQDTLFHSK